MWQEILGLEEKEVEFIISRVVIVLSLPWRNSFSLAGKIMELLRLNIASYSI